MRFPSRFACLLVLLPTAVCAFVVAPPSRQTRSSWSPSPRATRTALSSQQQTVTVETLLTEKRETELFAWISRVFAGDARYNNLMLAFAAIFGDMSEDAKPKQMVRDALAKLPKDEEETPVGTPIALVDREMSSLGAMGAAQWTGQYRTRPHSLLQLQNYTCVDDWVRTLPRGVKRTLKRANAQNFTVTTKPILGSKPAPHSSLAHFRCVLQHEVRLLAECPDTFFNALDSAIGRYIGTTRMAGDIQEYRNDNGKVIAFAHEVRKGKTIRGQWFYATDEASKSYVWFHSVQELVRRAIETHDVTVVDLGPSGSDSFTQLKERYGFVSVDDWPAVADYYGPFVHCEEEREEGMGVLLEAMERPARQYRIRRF